MESPWSVKAHSIVNQYSLMTESQIHDSRRPLRRVMVVMTLPLAEVEATRDKNHKNL